MRKSIFSIAVTAALMCSCEEWQPVTTFHYAEPENYQTVTMNPTHTIAQIAQMYVVGQPYTFTEDYVIGGKVVSNDREGNIYKSLYIQDETGGIEIKMGKSSLYSDYKEGQTIYVKLQGLTLGMYGYKEYKEYASGPSGGSGMVQIGLEDPTNEYETSYLELDPIIASHIIRGERGDVLVAPEIGESELPKRTALAKDCKYIGQKVTVKNLKYANEIFLLAYINSNLDKSASSNRIFLSDDSFGVDTWAMSKYGFISYLENGNFDEVQIGNSGDYNYGTVADYKEQIKKNAQAGTLSQYFKCGNTEVVIRTSGYAKFADKKIPQSVIDGTATIDATGILTLYQGTIQLMINSLDDIKVNE